MNSKFTAAAQNALQEALALARRLGHTYIGSEHLLAGLLTEPDSTLSRMLSQRGVTVDKLIARMVAVSGKGEESAVSARDMTPRLKRTLAFAETVAHNRKKTVIGSEHLLRAGRYECSLPDFLEQVKTKLGCKGLRYVDGGKPVSKVAVGGGSCGSALPEVIEAGCDTFVTADIKYNQFWDAKAFGINLIDAGHFQTENPVCAVLAEKIQTAFPELKVILAKSHRDCMEFY